jgi:UDP-glucuronate decarboxylase
LGSHLCKRLLDEGHAVICADNLSTGSEANIHALRAHPNFTFLRHDVTVPLEIRADRIFNLACPASPVHYQSDAIRTVKTSVQGAIHMLDLAKRNKARIFQASTSEVYGDPERHPQTEDYWGHVNPIGIRSCYDEGKRCAETLFFDYHRQHGIDIRVGRIFNTYGPHMHPDDGRVVSNFILQALRGQDITIYGDGGQTRSFCYVDDLIEVIARMMDSDSCGPDPINIGNPVEITIRELARRVIAQTGAKSKLVEKPLPGDDPLRRCPDIARARRLLGWEPKVALDDGLRKTIAYFETVLSKDGAAS